jgi:hypothetical protein
MFDSQHDWFTHELQFHRKQWRCLYCKQRNPESRPDFITHLEAEHQNELTYKGVDGVDALVETCRIERIDATECPLCAEYGAKFQNINQSSKCDVSLKQFQQHLGGHMQQLALAALPQDNTKEEAEDDPDIDDDEDNEIEESDDIRRLRRDLSNSKQEVGGRHPRTLACQTRLATALSLENRQEAGQLQLDVVERTKLEKGQYHLDTQKAMANLVRIWLQLGRTDMAEELQAQISDWRIRGLWEEGSDAEANMRTMVMPDRMRWLYVDPQGQVQGPFSGLEMHDWYKASFFEVDLPVKKVEDAEFEPLGQLIRRIGNSREPFLVPQIGVPHGPATTQAGALFPPTASTSGGGHPEDMDYGT